MTALKSHLEYIAATNIIEENASLVSGYELNNQEINPIAEAAIKATNTSCEADTILVKENQLIYSVSCLDSQGHLIGKDLIVKTIDPATGGIKPLDAPKVIKQQLPDIPADIFVDSLTYNNKIYASYSASPSSALKNIVVSYDVIMNDTNDSTTCSYITFKDGYMDRYIESDILTIFQKTNQIFLALITSNGHEQKITVANISRDDCMQMQIIAPHEEIDGPIKVAADEVQIVFNNEVQLLIAAVVEYWSESKSQVVSALEAWRIDENGVRSAIEGQPFLEIKQEIIDDIRFLPDGCHLLMLSKKTSNNIVFNSFISLYRINDPDSSSKCYRPLPPISMEIGVSVAGSIMLTTAAVIVCLVVCHILRKRGRRMGYQPLEQWQWH